jgi:ATP-binding cassette subfamily B protein
VDVATEHEVFAGLRSQLQKKTVVIVSNRIKLLSMTDQTLILDEGRIVQRGGHAQLLRENAFYRTMYDKQMRREEARDSA